MYNKVEYNGETLIDLTDTTATENDVVQGKKFHDKSGALREGNAVPQTYTAGAGIDITAGEISAKVDGTTIDTNNDNELKISQELQNTINNKVDKVQGKGLSTNDFTNAYKSKIETNEYNDIFNIRVEWDREYMPHAELIRIYFQYYESGRLAEDDPVSYNVKDITNSSVYLYKNTSDQWAIAVGTPPSSYHRLPMLVGKIATKTVGGESVKLFFRNGDDETQFDKLNSEKVDKETGKGLSTNDFTNEYKSKIETNEYNDVFNVRVEWDRQYMPNAELIAISFQEYENGILVNKVLKDNVKDITNGNVYLYKDIRDLWIIAVGTPPSSYHRLPMLVGKIATKTVNGTTVKLFFRNDDDEAQFDKLNSGKVDSDLLVPLTQSAYDNLPSVNPDAYYFIEEE